MTRHDMELIRQIVREELASMAEVWIGTREVAAIMGYKNVSTVLKNAAFFGGCQDGAGKSWRYPRSYVLGLKRDGKRPPVEFRGMSR